MAKAIPDLVADKDLDYIKAKCDKMTICNDQPTTFTEGNATFALADVAMASGDFTIQNHSPDGRELVAAAKNSVPIDSSGTGTHIALLNTADSELLAVTTCSSIVLTSGGTVNIPSWKLVNRDPT